MPGIVPPVYSFTSAVLSHCHLHASISAGPVTRLTSLDCPRIMISVSVSDSFTMLMMRLSDYKGASQSAGVTRAKLRTELPDRTCSLQSADGGRT